MKILSKISDLKIRIKYNKGSFLLKNTYDSVSLPV